MHRRLGPIAPTTSQLAALERRVADITDDVGAFSVLLSPKERHRALKPRTGGETIVRLVGRIAEEQGVVLPNLTVEQMSANVALAESLLPLAAAVRELDQRIADTMLQAKSESWNALTAYYSTLVRLSGANLDIARAIAPAVEFFATGPRKRVA
nr:hypothetical protein [Kofleriaceae bacterium]